MISIIIPTFNEADRLGPLLTQLHQEPETHEIIVVDGGSTDATVALAVAAGVRVIHAPRGRGTQLRAGAEVASGRILWLLHADCRPGAGALRAMLHNLPEDSAVVGGNFQLIFDGDERFSRWLTGFYRGIRRYGLYYGDSGIFLRATVYRQIGGIRPYPIMEDFELIRQLRKVGPQVCIGHPPLVTSSRRFQRRHPLRICAGWLLIHLLYWLRVSPQFLGWLYYAKRI